MKLLPRIIFCVILGVLTQQDVYAQNCSSINIQHQSDIATDCPHMTMTMKPDNLGRPFLYVANKESGLVIYNITDLASPALAKSIPINSLDSLHVMNLSQNGNYLYLALGNHFTDSQSPGMAIVDVSDPANAFVTDVWKSSESDGGAGIVKTENNYAYLGAMKHGLIIFDISDKSSILFVSQFIPDYTYPVSNPDSTKYNARGMEVRNDIVYLCFDAGGVRIINTTDKLHPVETGRYSNPVLNNLPRAYNNIAIDDTLAYVTADYCGMEVLNLTDTNHIAQVSWWNPWHCQSNPLNWFSSPGHTNEIEFNKDCKQLFIASGKSDLHVVDISNPLHPDSCNFYGGVSNDIGTWGVALSNEKIFLSYVCAIIPFTSNWTGVKILTYTPCLTAVNHVQGFKNAINLYPSPAANEFTVDLNNEVDWSKLKISVVNVLGQNHNLSYKVSGNKLTVKVSELTDGIYFLKLLCGSQLLSKTFVKQAGN